MRAHAWFFLSLLAGCKPSATYESTMPVANLQTFRSVGLRVHTNAFAAQGRAAQLEQSVIGYLRQKCGFEGVDKASSGQDLVIDLNITALGRGGGGMISNPNLATVDTLLVLTDGINGELLGTAKVRGKSSGMIVNNSNPENEAIDVVAKTIVETMAKSGCSGPRVARAVEQPQPPTVVADGSAGSAAVPPPVDEAKRAEADALNQAGKEKLYTADLQGALASFQQANTLVPDARYQFNVCLTYCAQEQWGEAGTACKTARSMNPSAELAARIDQRIEIIQKHP